MSTRASAGMVDEAVYQADREAVDPRLPLIRGLSGKLL